MTVTIAAAAAAAATVSDAEGSVGTSASFIVNGTAVCINASNVASPRRQLRKKENDNGKRKRLF